MSQRKRSSHNADKQSRQNRSTSSSKGHRDERDQNNHLPPVLSDLAKKTRREHRHDGSPHRRRSSSRQKTGKDRTRSSTGSAGNDESLRTSKTSPSTSSEKSPDPVLEELQEKATTRRSQGDRGSHRRSRHSSSHRRTSHRSRSNHSSRSSSSSSSLAHSARSRTSSSVERTISSRRSASIEDSQTLSSARRKSHRRRSTGSRRSSSSSHSRRTTRHDRRRSTEGTSTRDHSQQDDLVAVGSDADSSLGLDDLLVPGRALDLGSIGHISVLSTSSHDPSLPAERGHAEEDHHYDSSERSSTQNTNLRSICEVQEEQPIVQAITADDYENQLEEARRQGRMDALRQTGNGNIVIAVEARDDHLAGDDDDDDFEDESKRKKRVFCYLSMLCCIIVVAASTCTLLLFGDKQNTGVSNLMEVDDKSNLKAVIVYNPPTFEECQAIADGTMPDEQLSSLIQRSFDIQLDITLADESDSGDLFADLLGHIQKKLIPIMAGCQAIDFFDATTIALSDELSNATGAIANGQAQAVTEQPCEGGSNGNCRSYVLILDLYLEEDLSKSILLEIIGQSIDADEVASTIGALYPVQSASVSNIVPRMDGEGWTNNNNNNNNITSAPTAIPFLETSEQTSAPVLSPTLEPSSKLQTTLPTSGPNNSIQATTSPSKSPIPPSPVSAPSSAPIQMPIPSQTKEPTKNPVQSATGTPVIQPTMAPTPHPKEGTTTPVQEPSSPPTLFPSPITTPTREPSLLPTTAVPTLSPKDPTPSPTKAPTTTPTREPSLLPTTEAPTLLPVIGPTKAPSRSPTKAPSRSPTVAPSQLPTSSPSTVPTVTPSTVPTVTPSKSPTDTPSRMPTSSPTHSPTTSTPSRSPTDAPSTTPEPVDNETFCCSKNFLTCGGVYPVCQTSQFACALCLSAWIQEGFCKTGLGRNDNCSSNPTGCCAGTCKKFGSTKKCRLY